MVGNLVEGYKNTGINIRQEVEASEIQRLHLSRKTSSISTSLPTTSVLHFDTACKFIWLLVKNQRRTAYTCCVPLSAGGLLSDSSMLTMSLPN